MSPLLQERATPAAAQPLQPLPLGEEQQQQLERENSDSDSSGEESDSDSSGEDSDSDSSGEESDSDSRIDLQKALQDLEAPVCVYVCSAGGGGCGLRGAATSSVLCLAGLVCDVV